MKNQRKIVVSTALLMLMVSGCRVQSYTIGGTSSYNSTTGSTETVTTTIQIVPHATVGNVDPTDLSSTASSNIVFPTSQDALNFSPDSSGIPTATLVATTDTGYQTSVTVQLQPVSAAINPLNPGDAVYSYAITDSPALETWAQQASQNAQSSVSLAATGSLPFISAQAPGNYTLSGQTTSSVTDPSGVATAIYSVPDPNNNGCNGRPHCLVLPPGN
jgi:hypothetical protein